MGKDKGYGVGLLAPVGIQQFNETLTGKLNFFTTFKYFFRPYISSNFFIISNSLLHCCSNKSPALQ